MEEKVRNLFGQDIEFKISLVDILAQDIAKAAQRLVDCLLNDGKIFVCANGGSAANSIHFSNALLNYFDVERPSLPVINLTTDCGFITAMLNEGDHYQIFARQIQALSKTNDVLVIISTTGNSNTLLEAINAAHDNDMDVISLNGKDGGLITNHLGPEDIEIRINTENSAKIRELHLFILHCFCNLIDRSLFGHEAE